MQLTQEETLLLQRLVSIALDEILWDYSYASDMGVLSMNGKPIILDRQQINQLLSIRNAIYKETKLW